MYDFQKEWIKNLMTSCQNIDSYSSTERETVFSDLQNSYFSFSEKDQIVIANILKEILEDYDYLYVLSIMAQYMSSSAWIPCVIEKANRMDFDIFVRSMLEVQLHIRGKASYIDIRQFHKETLEMWERELDLNIPYMDMHNRNDRRIVIVTEQILSTLHAPTKVVFDYAYVLQHIMGFEVMLLACPSNGGDISDIWYQAIQLRSNSEFGEGEVNIRYQDEIFRGVQVEMAEMNIQKYRDAVLKVLQWNPLFILNYGVINPMTDIFSKYTTVVAENASTTLPISEAQILVDSGNNDELTATLHQRIIKPMKVLPNFGTAKQTHTRDMYGIRDDQFVLCVVGNRLEQEADDEFLRMLGTVTDTEKNIAVAFVGNMQERIADVKRYVDSEQLYFIDYCDDLLGLYSLMNLYVNPRRMGGGFSGAMAIAAGLPVITMDYGDVVSHTGSDYAVKDYTEMQSVILRCSSDPDYLAQRQTVTDRMAQTMTKDNYFAGIQKNFEEMIHVMVSLC